MFSALTADSTLTALLGGVRVYDDVPQGTPLPYLTLGQMTERDWSTGGEPGTEAGSEHSLVLQVWSSARGKKEAHDIIGAVRAALHDRPLALAGHRLVNLRHEVSETRRDPDGESIRATLRFRAVTEPA
ncbi:MAG: DUF3168 domain-containing protein [Hyphomonadaceae bacterium]|nr:DUF3168 domain-containing protein [Hyphomonadaceae bacterium]